MVNDLIFRLCRTFSGAGTEKDIAELIKSEMQPYAEEIFIDKNNNIICKTGKKNAARHILVEAHIDQISLVVTAIDDAGFLNVAPCGGIDCRTLPGSAVIIHGKEAVTGIVCSTPPHLTSKDNDDFEKTENVVIDTGLTAGKARELIAVGDYISFDVKPKTLLGNRITSPALDNRAGAAALILCAQMLKDAEIDAQVTFLFSSQEEIHALGAKTAAFALDPTEAIAVDVSFAKQPGVAEEKSRKLSHGPMIGISPVLYREISNKLINLAKQAEIPHQLEIMGASTGTTVDAITSSKSGIPGGLLSIPLRNMHTPVEIVDVTDVENTAKLLALYILNGGICNG